MRVAVLRPPFDGEWGDTEAFVLLAPDASFIDDDSLPTLIAPLRSPRVGLVYGDSLRDGIRIYRRPFSPDTLAVGPNVVVSRLALEAIGGLNGMAAADAAIRISRRFAIIHVPVCVIQEGATNGVI